MAKRLFDLAFAALGLLFLSPVLLLIAIAIKLHDGGAILFRQERIGLCGKPFKILKFRTMAEQQTPSSLAVTSAKDNRITRPGRFLRSTKLDELPQLINVVRGEMSIVGPRPEVERFMEEYSAEQRAVILSIRPGITDLAAIAMRDEEQILAQYDDVERAYIDVVMPRKFELYREYVERASLKLDMEIILKTILALFR